MTSERELDSFSWVPLEKWTVDTIFNNSFFHTPTSICKICDEAVSNKDREHHVATHILEAKRLKSKRKAQAKKNRIEGQRRRRREKNEGSN